MFVEALNVMVVEREMMMNVNVKIMLMEKIVKIFIMLVREMEIWLVQVEENVINKMVVSVKILMLEKIVKH